MQSGCWCGGRGEGDAGRGLDASPGAAADVDVCTMAAKPVMYLCFCRQLLPKVPGWKKRPSPLSAPAKQNNPNDHQHQICSKYCAANKTSRQTMSNKLQAKIDQLTSVQSTPVLATHETSQSFSQLNGCVGRLPRIQVWHDSIIFVSFHYLFRAVH